MTLKEKEEWMLVNDPTKHAAIEVTPEEVSNAITTFFVFSPFKILNFISFC